MPLTPKFSISQNDEFVVIEINVPWVRVGDMEFVVDGCDFSFFCNPYLLKLQFPYPCVDDERAKAVYDVDKNNGTVYVHIPKEEKGQFFPNMDLLSTILKKSEPLPEMPRGPLVQEITPSGDAPKKEEPAQSSEETSKDLLELEEPTKSYRKYGFDELFQNVFKSFEDCSEIIENPVPDDNSVDPIELMKQMEESKFDADHYLSDYFYGKEDYLYTEFIDFLPDWVKADRIIRKHLKEVSSPPLVPFSSFDPLPSIKSAQPASLSTISSSISQTIAISQSPSQTISSSPSPSLIHPLGSSDKPSHRLVEEIAEEPETPHERLEGGSGIPSLLLIVPQETNHQKPENDTKKQSAPSPSSEAAIPTLSRQQVPLAATLRRQLQSLRVSHEETESQCTLSADERELLLSVKNVNVTVAKERLNQALFSLVDILCAYCYDVRMTQHDATPESAWTISILSPTLSWLIPSSSLRNTLIAFIRRVLIYPYLRRYDLARLCIKDCIVILKLGTRRILKCLLDIKRIMKYSERKYILNTLYIDKYILWIQTLDYAVLYDVAEEMNYLLSHEISRDVLDLGIPELEAEGKEMLQQEE
ncbi:hypothetical protein WA588_001022 [Blastocystis sp. NMH]